MKDKTLNRWSTYELFSIELADRKVADIVITRHAQLRWAERVGREQVNVVRLSNEPNHH